MIMLTPTRAYAAFAAAVLAVGLAVLALPDRAQQIAVLTLTYGTLTGAAGWHVVHALRIRRRAVLERNRIDGPPASWSEWWDRSE